MAEFGSRSPQPWMCGARAEILAARVRGDEIRAQPADWSEPRGRIGRTRISAAITSSGADGGEEACDFGAEML
ncbi:hypothetical protein CTI14_38250, partial [Methylobacterium radiotolerans]